MPVLMHGFSTQPCQMHGLELLLMKHGSNKKEALLFQCDTLRVSSFVIERLRPAGGTRARV